MKSCCTHFKVSPHEISHSWAKLPLDFLIISWFFCFCLKKAQYPCKILASHYEYFPSWRSWEFERMGPGFLNFVGGKISISIFRAKRQAPLPWTFEQFSHKSLEKNTKAIVWVNMWDRRWFKTSYSIWKVSLLPTFWYHTHLAAVPSGSQWFSNIVRFELCVMFQRLKSADCEGSGGSCWLIFFFLKWPWLMINIWCHVFFYIAKGNLSTWVQPLASKYAVFMYL